MQPFFQELPQTQPYIKELQTIQLMMIGREQKQRPLLEMPLVQQVLGLHCNKILLTCVEMRQDSIGFLLQALKEYALAQVLSLEKLLTEKVLLYG